MKIIKASIVILIGLIIWIGFTYIGIAFLKAETNPFIWSKSSRAILLFLVVCYLCFIPLIIMSIKDEFNN
jgi:hypothetical protein